MMEQAINRMALSPIEDINEIYETMVFLNDFEGIEPEHIVIEKMKKNYN